MEYGVVMVIASRPLILAAVLLYFSNRKKQFSEKVVAQQLENDEIISLPSTFGSSPQARGAK